MKFIIFIFSINYALDCVPQDGKKSPNDIFVYDGTDAVFLNMVTFGLRD